MTAERFGEDQESRATATARTTDAQPEHLLAWRLYDAMMAESNVRQEAGDALITALGFDPEKYDEWIWNSDLTFDWYDTSFEFHGIFDLDWCPTRSQLNKCWALGFSRCWFNYTDHTERYCGDSNSVWRRTHIGERKAKAVAVALEPAVDLSRSTPNAD